VRLRVLGGIASYSHNNLRFNSCDLPNLDGHTTVNPDLLGRITTGGANVENLDAYDGRNVAVAIQFWRDSNSAAG
jgi:hypothetical protein